MSGNGPFGARFTARFGPIQTLEDFVDMLRRRARLMVRVIAAGCLMSVLYALSQQHLYTSTEVIQIAPPDIANDLELPIVPGGSARHFQRVQQQVTARGSLLEIIDGFGLYAEFPGLTPRDMVDRLRGSIRVDAIAASGNAPANDGLLSALAVTAEMPSARQAQLVAHEMARRIIALSTLSRMDRARAALDVLTARENNLTDEIAALTQQVGADHTANPQLAINKTPPVVAREPRELHRQLQNAQLQRHAVIARRAQAELGLQLAIKQQADWLTVIEPATLQDVPVTGSRKRLAMLGSLCSVILALALAYILELRAPVIRSARQMEREIGIAPVVSIPFLDAAPHRPSRWRRLRAWFGAPFGSGKSAT